LSEFTFTDLRQHWNQEAQRERDNPPKDKPSHAFMLEHGHPMNMAPLDQPIWVIEENSVGVFLAQKLDGSWFCQDGGDLWPCRPVKWFERRLDNNL
jgi:hypothetical protein